MRMYARCWLAGAFFSALAAGAIAQSPSGSTVSASDKGRVPDIFDDVSQLVRVDAKTTREIVKKFQLDNPSP